MSADKGKTVFSFEEEISHNIDQALAVGSTGIGPSFFADPYVKVMFDRYGTRYSMYPKKLCRLLRCANDTIQAEVSEWIRYYKCFSIDLPALIENFYSDCLHGNGGLS